MKRAVKRLPAGVFQCPSTYVQFGSAVSRDSGVPMVTITMGCDHAEHTAAMNLADASDILRTLGEAIRGAADKALGETETKRGGRA